MKSKSAPSGHSLKKVKLAVNSLKNTLTVTDRQGILNNGTAGMRSILLYLDTIAAKVDELEKEILKKED